MNWDNYECDGQMNLFDFIEPKENKFNPYETLALRGTGFVGGMKRVLNYFSESHTLQEKAKFLKKEYGLGGFGSPVKKPCYIHDMDSFGNGKDGIRFRYYDEDMNDIETHCSWDMLAKVIDNLIKENRYVNTENPRHWQ